MISRIVFRGNDFDLAVKIGENTIRYTESTINYKPRTEGEDIRLYFYPQDAVIFPNGEEKGEGHEKLETA